MESNAVARGGSAPALAALLVAIALAAPEAVLFGEQLRWGALGAKDGLLLRLVLAAASLLALAPAVGLGLLLERRGRPRAGLAVVGVAAALLGWFLLCDLRCARVTGNHLAAYAGFLGGHDPLQWGGDLRGLASAALEQLVLAAALAALACAAARALARRLPARVDRPAVAVAGYLTLALSPALGPLAAAEPLALVRLGATLPTPYPLVRPPIDPRDALQTLDARLEALYPAFEAPLHTPRPVDPRPKVPAGGRPPNVVLIVLESLRAADAFDPAVMPRLDRWSRGGLRLRAHRAGGNASHLGLFQLLYGLGALAYVEQTRAQVPSTLCDALRRGGYDARFISSSRTEWWGMDLFLSRLNFDEVTTDDDDDWWVRDLRTLGRVKRPLLEGARPQLVLTFLMSSHFDYVYPPTHARFPTTLVRGEEWAGIVSNTWGDRTKSSEALVPQVRARYRNALAFLDDAVMDLVDALDPAKNVVVVTGDHGESFLEDGVWLHSSRLSDVQTHVPCVVVGPGVPAAEVDAPTLHADLAPTLLHAVGAWRGPLAHGPGRDLLEALPARDRPVLLVGLKLQDMALVTGGERLHLGLDQERTRLRTDGPLDARGLFDPSVRLGLGDVDRWLGLVEAELRAQAR